MNTLINNETNDTNHKSLTKAAQNNNRESKKNRLKAGFQQVNPR